MALFEELERIPKEVRNALGNTATATELIRWWNAKHPLLHDQTPCTLWEAGKHQDVLDFIKAGKSGDMA